MNDIYLPTLIFKNRKMNDILKKISLALLIVLANSSCKEEDDSRVEPEALPRAIITVNSTAAPLDTVFVDGSSSQNAETFKWSGSSSAGGTIDFYNLDNNSTSSGSKVYFIAKNTGTYSIALEVKKGGQYNQTFATIDVSGAPQIGGTLSENLTLNNINVSSSDSCDYFLTEDLIIPSGMKLEIEDGVRICVAQGVSIISEGRLDINGSVGVIIEALGDNWKGIHIKNGYADINGLTIDEAGSSSFSTNPEEKAGIYIEKSIDNLSNCSFVNSNGYGLVMKRGVEINGSYYANYDNNASGPAILSLETFIQSPGASQFYNTLPNKRLGLRGATVNGLNIQKLDIPYHLFESIQTNGNLIIQAGTEIYMSDTIGLKVNGVFNSLGTQSQPVVIQGMTQAAGSWKGINANGIVLEFTTIQHAGSSKLLSNGGTNFEYSCGLMLGTSGYFKLENCTLSNNTGYGLVIYDGPNIPNFVYDNNTISNNGTGAILVSTAYVSIISENQNSSYLGYGSKPIITIHGQRSRGIASSSFPAQWNKLSAAVSSTDYKFLEGDYNVASNASWTVEKGVFIECDEDVSIEIGNYATFDAQGSVSEKINFRKANNSSAENWDGIYADFGAILKLEYTNINYGGNGSGNYQGCLNLHNNVDSVSSFVKNCTFLNGSTYDLYFPGGIDAIGIKEISNNNIFINTN